MFIKYATGNGSWNYEIYRKKTKKEIENNPKMAWKMHRIGNIVSLDSRQEAETEAFTKAFKILNDRLNNR